MSYPKILQILGWSELPATASEGMFFQPAELATIEAGLMTSEEIANTDLANKAALATANKKIEELEAAAVIAANFAATNAATITGLNTAIAVLGGKSSGAAGSNLAIEEEVAAGDKTTGFFAWDSPEHPANKAAAKRGIKLTS